MEQSTFPPLRVLIPLDGSVQANRALDAAKELRPAHLTLLRVITNDFFGIPGTMLGQDDEEFAPVREEMDGLAESLRTTGTRVDTVVMTGDPAHEIIAAAEDCDLIIMTTRGHGAASRALFGSVADRVSRHSKTPTMLIRSQAGTSLAPRRRVVVPLDGSDRAEAALSMAANLAGTLGVPVQLLRAVGLNEVRAAIQTQREADQGPPDAADTFDAARAEAEDLALAYLETVAEPLRANGLAVETEVLRGEAAFVLLWNTKADDLLVMTSHGHSGFRRWLLGSVAEKLVREGEAPMVLVPTRDGTDQERREN